MKYCIQNSNVMYLHILLYSAKYISNLTQLILEIQYKVVQCRCKLITYLEFFYLDNVIKCDPSLDKEINCFNLKLENF